MTVVNILHCRAPINVKVNLTQHDVFVNKLEYALCVRHEALPVEVCWGLYGNVAGKGGPLFT